MQRPDPESQEGRHGNSFRNPKVYATREEAVARFRLVPPQPCDNNIWRLVPENFWCGKWEWGPQEPIPGKQLVPVREEI